MITLNEKQKFTKKNFEYHARIAAQTMAEQTDRRPSTREAVYQGIMAFVDSAFEAGKIEVKENPQWDEAEREFHQAVRNEGLKRGEGL